MKILVKQSQEFLLSNVIPQRSSMPLRNCLEVKCLDIDKVILLAVTRSKIEEPNRAAVYSAHNHTPHVEYSTPFHSYTTSQRLLCWLIMVAHSEYVCLKSTCSSYRKNINVESPGRLYVLDVKTPRVWWGGDELLCVLLKVIGSIKPYRGTAASFPSVFE